jgi:glycosyltransferase involved in cell wall biosynthesis
MRDSRVWAHPSWSTLAGGPFEEASCIAAMEAQAAGLWVVASGWGALSETVRVGAVIQEGAPGEPWRSRFVEEIVRGLTDADTRRRAEAEGPSAMAEMGWGRVAARIARVIENGAR